MIEFSTAPILASALQFAFEKATLEGKLTICGLLIVSFFSWTVIFAKTRQLARASKMTRRFFEAYAKTRDPLELSRTGQKFVGAPAYETYRVAIEETEYHLKHSAKEMNGERRMSSAHFDVVKVAMERAASNQVLILEKGMIVLSTAVSGGPFLGLLGTVWGVMETFAGIARASAASLTAMAPGVAGALIATVVGLFVAIPAMFAYNFMVTRVRSLTQQQDAFASELASVLELNFVDATPWLTHGHATAATPTPAPATPATKAAAAPYPIPAGLPKPAVA